MFDIQKMMKQAQKMQDQMKTVQDEMEKTEFDGSAANDAVKVTINGKYQFLRVAISDEAMGDKDMLEDLVLTACRDATTKVSTTLEDKMGSLTNGMNIPGMNLPGF